MLRKQFLFTQNGILRHEAKRQVQEVFRDILDGTERVIADLLRLAGIADTINTRQHIRYKAVIAVFAGNLARNGTAKLGAIGNHYHGNAVGNTAAGADDTAHIFAAGKGAFCVAAADRGQR